MLENKFRNMIHRRNGVYHVVSSIEIYRWQKILQIQFKTIYIITRYIELSIKNPRNNIPINPTIVNRIFRQ